MTTGADLGNAEINTLVVAGGKLPHSFRVQTSKLLDVRACKETTSWI